MNCVWDSEEVGLIPKCSAALTNAKNPLHYLIQETNYVEKMCFSFLERTGIPSWAHIILLGSLFVDSPNQMFTYPKVHVHQQVCENIWPAPFYFP